MGEITTYGQIHVWKTKRTDDEHKVIYTGDAPRHFDINDSSFAEAINRAPYVRAEEPGMIVKKIASKEARDSKYVGYGKNLESVSESLSEKSGYVVLDRINFEGTDEQFSALKPENLLLSKPKSTDAKLSETQLGLMSKITQTTIISHDWESPVSHSSGSYHKRLASKINFTEVPDNPGHYTGQTGPMKVIKLEEETTFGGPENLQLGQKGDWVLVNPENNRVTLINALQAEKLALKFYLTDNKGAKLSEEVYMPSDDKQLPQLRDDIDRFDPERIRRGGGFGGKGTTPGGSG